MKCWARYRNFSISEPNVGGICLLCDDLNAIYIRSDEKKMVEKGSMDTTHSYYIVCHTDDIALRASRAEPYTEAGHGNGI